MGIFDIFGFSKTSSSAKAKDRLRIIVESNPKSAISKHMKSIQQEIFGVLAKYLQIPQEAFSMQIDEDKGRTVLELCVQMPNTENQHSHVE